MIVVEFFSASKTVLCIQSMSFSSTSPASFGGKRFPVRRVDEFSRNYPGRNSNDCISKHHHEGRNELAQTCIRADVSIPYGGKSYDSPINGSRGDTVIRSFFVITNRINTMILG